VAQSYNIFNRFGKDSSAIADITRAFIEDLQGYSIDQITGAFKQWRQTESGMPVPANIQNIIKQEKINTGDDRILKWSEFQASPAEGYRGDWNSYKEYLERKNIK
jgi:hypothetical protein